MIKYLKRNRFKFIMTLNKFRRKLALKRRGFVLFIAIFLVCYIFGVFTHLFELDISEFTKETNHEFTLAMQELNLNQAYDLDTYYDVNRLNFTFLHESAQTCSARVPPYLVIVVKSKYSHFEQRQSIRQTWGKNHENIIRTVFLTGLSSWEHNQLIKDESLKYGDVIQQDFIDSYYNNTLKTSMALKWIYKFCPNSKYYLLIDDDFYLNPNLLMKYLNTVDDKQYADLYAGFVFPKSSPMRHLTSKWYISLKAYPYSKFPPYVSAGCYVLSQKSAKKFYLATKFNKLFKFDDIYMGILSMRLNIKPQHIEEIYYYPPSYSPTVYSKSVIASHGFNSNELTKIWTQLEALISFKSSNFKLV